MKDVHISKEFFIANRKRLADKMLPKSVAIFNANDIMPTSADGTMPYKQNTDLFYLCGVKQEETILVLYPDATEEKHREMIFVRETNEYIQNWEGKKLSKVEARELTGIQSTYWTSEFQNVFHAVMCECENVYLNTNEHGRQTTQVQSRDARFIEMCKEVYPLHEYKRLAPIMADLRAIKSEHEVILLQEACDLTGNGFRRVLKFLKPGVMEWEVEAEYAHEFISSGAGYADYEPIIASGSSACVLHYIENNKECKDGDLLLMDVAAGVANYNADLTRTVPVNGRFTKRQKDVYNAVLRVFKGTRANIVSGKMMADHKKLAEQLIEKELVDLGLLKMDDIKNEDQDKPLFRKYYMHGVSHFLGLNVHDVGDYRGEFKPGMVFTCEPGIYIKDEGIGIRLENDILITAHGNLDLMEHIPIEAEEIEDIMNR